MKKSLILVLFVIFLFILTGCSSDGTNSNPYFDEGNVVIDNIEIAMTDLYPYYSGTVKNVGDVIVHGVNVEFTIFETAAKENVLYSGIEVTDMPANLQDINPGESAAFLVDVWEASAISDIENYDVNVTWIPKLYTEHELTELKLQNLKYDLDGYHGQVYNSGTQVITDAQIRFNIYQTEQKQVIIDTCDTLLGNYNSDSMKWEIAPGETVTFDAEVFDADLSKLDNYKYKIIKFSN